MMKKYNLIYLTALLYSLNLYANTPWSPIGTLYFGPEWTAPTQKTQLMLQPNMTKAYEASTNTNTLMGVGLFLGGQRLISAHSTLQLGATVEMTSVASIQGNIWEDADPNFNNYLYQYNLSPFRTMISAHWSDDHISALFDPYVHIGLGASFNRSYHYQITPKLFEELPAPPFTANTSASFTYIIGTGIQKTINKHMIAGIGYSFSDWGRSQLGTAFSQTTNDRLSLSHLYTHQLALHLSYLI